MGLSLEGWRTAGLRNKRSHKGHRHIHLHTTIANQVQYIEHSMMSVSASLTSQRGS